MKTFSIFLLCLMTTLANAAGPLFVEGANGTTPVKYKNPNIVLNFDIDALAVTLNDTNAESDQLVLDAFNLWNNVLTSTANLNQGPDLPANVDSNNYTAFIPAGIGASIKLYVSSGAR